MLRSLKADHGACRSAAGAVNLHSENERAELERVGRSRSAPRNLVHLVQIILVSTDDEPNVSIAARLGVAELLRTVLESMRYALDCSLGLGCIEGVTHDHVGHGSTTPFAALDIANGQVLTRCKPHHLEEFPGFLRHIDANVRADLDVHLVDDNHATQN